MLSAFFFPSLAFFPFLVVVHSFFDVYSCLSSESSVTSPYSGQRAFFLIHYIKEFCESLGLTRFAVVRLSGYQLTDCDARHTRERYSGIGVWEDRWVPRGNCTGLGPSCYFQGTYSFYILCYDKVGYDWPLVDDASHIHSVVEVDCWFVRFMMLLHLPVHMAVTTTSRNGCTGHVTFILTSEPVVAVHSSLLDASVWSHSRESLKTLVKFCLTVEQCGFHITVGIQCQWYLLLCLPTIFPSPSIKTYVVLAFRLWGHVILYASCHLAPLRLLERFCLIPQRQLWFPRVVLE